MKALFAVSLFLYSFAAQADRILIPGELYFAQYQGERISCQDNGGGMPDRYDFEAREKVDHAQDWQNHSEFNARSMCEGNGQAQVFFSATVQKLQRDATAECMRSYDRCQQLGQVQGDFIPKERNRGHFGCFLRVTVRGTR